MLRTFHMMTPYKDIAGAERLVERFGDWPSFHDAEVIRVVFDRRGENRPTAELLVHVWLMTNSVDERGYYVLEKHTLVRFVFERIVEIQLSEFNRQNVLFDLEISPETVDGAPAYRVTLTTSYGLEGWVVCGRIVVADVAASDERGNPVDER
jgi:hypothetical protein